MHKMAGSQGGRPSKRRRTSWNSSPPILQNSDTGSPQPESQMFNGHLFGDNPTFMVPGMPGMSLYGPGRMGLCCGAFDQAHPGMAPMGMGLEGLGMMLTCSRPPVIVGPREMNIGPNIPREMNISPNFPREISIGPNGPPIMMGTRPSKNAETVTVPGGLVTVKVGSTGASGSSGAHG